MKRKEKEISLGTAHIHCFRQSCARHPPPFREFQEKEEFYEKTTKREIPQAHIYFVYFVLPGAINPSQVVYWILPYVIISTLCLFPQKGRVVVVADSLPPLRCFFLFRFPSLDGCLLRFLYTLLFC